MLSAALEQYGLDRNIVLEAARELVGGDVKVEGEEDADNDNNEDDDNDGEESLAPHMPKLLLEMEVVVVEEEEEAIAAAAAFGENEDEETVPPVVLLLKRRRLLGRGITVFELLVLVQCTGGFGSTFGEGGSLNLAAA